MRAGRAQSRRVLLVHCDHNASVVLLQNRHSNEAFHRGWAVTIWESDVVREMKKGEGMERRALLSGFWFASFLQIVIQPEQGSKPQEREGLLSFLSRHYVVNNLQGWKEDMYLLSKA